MNLIQLHEACNKRKMLRFSVFGMRNYAMQSLNAMYISLHTPIFVILNYIALLSWFSFPSEPFPRTMMPIAIEKLIVILSLRQNKIKFYSCIGVSELDLKPL